MSQELTYRIGGLLRCCIGTLEEKALKNELPTQVGSTIGCQYHKDPNKPEMRLADDGVWEWIGTPR